MKRINRIYWLIAIAGSLAVSAQAQYQPVGEDGIAASPKLRQILDEQKARMNSAGMPAYQGGSEEQSMSDSPGRGEDFTQPIAWNPPTTRQGGSYSPLGDDGLVASPKLREQLNERQQRLEL